MIAFKRMCGVMLIEAVIFCGMASAAEKVIEWKFDGNLSDSSGNELHANPYPNALAIMYDDGVSGQALVSDGNDCAYLTGISTSVLPVLADDEWSVNLWVYPTVIPRDWRLAWCLGHKPDDNNKNSRSIYSSGYSSGSGKITFVGIESVDGGGAGTTFTVSSIPWDINQWQMITTTYDGAIVRMYKNGVLIAMRNQNFLDAPGEVRVPSYAWDSNNFFIGWFDEFTVWRGQLSQQEILDLIIPGVIPDVELNQQVVYYKMGDPTSSTMPDHSGQANDGTLYGYTQPLEDWIAEGFRADSLLFAGGQAINQTVTVSQPVNYTVTFWLKSGQQDYRSAFYSEKQVEDVPGGYGKGTQLIFRADNNLIKIESKDRDFHSLFFIGFDASAYLDGATWNHLAIVADGEAALASLYIDGQLLEAIPYPRSSHKTTGLDASVGRSLADYHYIGEWGPTYMDEVKIYNGALTEAQIQALAAHSNFDNDLQVGMEDAAVVAEDWLMDTQTSPGSIFVADDMEGSLDSWNVIDGYGGLYGSVSQTANAYAGSGALRWEYEVPLTTDPNKFYTNIRFDLGETKDLSVYDKLSLWLYRHTGNTPQDLLYLKFYTADVVDPNVKAEAWIDRADCAEEPAEEWSEWQIDLSDLLGYRGQGSASQEDLTDIRYILIGTGSQDRTEPGFGTIDLDELTFIANPTCDGRPTADLNRDCIVDLSDLAYLVDEWLFGIE